MRAANGVGTQGSGHRSSKNMPSKIVAILATLSAIAARTRLDWYLLEEVFVVLLAIAAMLVLTSLFAIGLVLFSNGARFGFIWLKVKVVRFIRMHRHFGPRQTTG
jgi:uncharacterized membrane protein